MGTGFDFTNLVLTALKVPNLLATLSVERILKSGDATIVFWSDGDKTVVKRAKDEDSSDYAAFTAALAIKVYGSNSAVKRIVSNAEVQKKKKGGETDGETA